MFNSHYKYDGSSKKALESQSNVSASPIIFSLGRYIVGLTFGNHILQQRFCFAVKLNFQPYIWRYTSPNENFEYSYPLSQSRCPGWSESSLGATTNCWFGHSQAHTHSYKNLLSLKPSRKGFFFPLTSFVCFTISGIPHAFLTAGIFRKSDCTSENVLLVNQ